MDLETRRFGASELFSSTPQCAYFPYNGGDAASSSGGDVSNSASHANRLDSVDAETSLIRAVYLDRKSELAAQTKRLDGVDGLDRATATKLLHLCCNFDSAECAAALLEGEVGEVPLVNELDEDSGKSPLHTAASAHAARCVEVLLKKHARTDLRTRDGQAQLALELSLSDSKMDLNWNTSDCSIEDLVVHISEKDLRTVKLLSEKTKEVAAVAYACAVKGRLASLTALLIAAAGEVNGCVLELRDSESGVKERVTLYEWLIREALALGRTTPGLRAARRAATVEMEMESESLERRKLLLREIELLQLFGAVAQSGGGEKKATSPLIRAAQGGDEAVIQLLLKTNINVNDADAEGNTALHWILKLSRLLCPQQIKILLLLLDHGAQVSQKNRLGLTAFHVAAGNGNSEALEVLLLKDPAGVQHKTEMKETPLFSAVKNESKECAELLLTWGANSEILNLRRQRAIDLATTQDMRYILLNPTTVSLINHAFPNQHKCMASQLTDEDNTTTTERNLNSSAKVEVCKYFDSHRGCVRGAKCFYAHCEEESQKVKEGAYQSHSKLFKRKIFVGGLPPSVDSDYLGKFCEEEFGSVEDSVVIVTQIGNKIQSRGFGFVTFRQQKSASEAMQAHYVTMRGKKVEIKSLIPKMVLGAEFEKMSPQQEQDRNIPLLQQRSNKNIMEGDNPEQGSWAARLVLKPTACSTEPGVTKNSKVPSTPTWLKIFMKWFPGFLKGLSKHPNYALSSLKADFRAKFEVELDHSSVGYAKLSDFLKCFSNLCTVELLPICKGGSPTHMIIRPKVSRPQRRVLLTTLGTPRTLSLSALNVNGGDSRCLSDPSTGDSSESMCLQDLSVNKGGDSKCQTLTIDSGSDLSADDAVDLKCPQDLSLDFGGDSQCIEDLSICNASEKSIVTSHGEEKSSPGYPEMNSAEDKVHSVHPRFLQFLKPDPLFYGQKETDVLAGETDDGKGQCTSGDKARIKVRDPRRHLVLESLSMKWSKSYFLRQFDFYKNYKERLSGRRCFGCTQEKMLWANFPCKHLLWCTECKMRAIGAAGLFPHKCVLCDLEVQKMELAHPIN